MFEENNNEESALDKELADVNKMADGFVDDEKVEEKKEEAKTEDEADKADDSDDEDDSDEKDQDDDSEEDEDSSENDEGDDQNEDGDDQDDQKDSKKDDKKSDDGKRASRPERYIPLKKYHDEKKVLNDKIKDLEEKLRDSGVKEGSKEEEEDIKAWAEKHGYEEEEVSGLVGIIRKELGVEDLRKVSEERQAEKEIEHFEKEFAKVEPSFKKDFPDATPKQLKQAKQKMDEFAFSEWGHDKDLDYILFKKRGEFAKIFGAGESSKTIEAGRHGGKGGDSPLSAKDFRGKSDFSKLQALPEEQRNKIISDLAPEDYANYGSWLGSNEDNLEIKRAGRVIKLR